MQSNRLRFRRYTPADYPFLESLVRDPDVVRYIGNGQVKNTEETKNFLDRILLGYGAGSGTGLLLLERKSDGKPIGHAGLIPQMVDGNHELEIGYWVAKDYWGEGYATEAATTLLEHGLKNLGRTRLISIIQPKNAASIRVAQKNGMTCEKRTEFKGQPCSIYVVRTTRVTG